MTNFDSIVIIFNPKSTGDGPRLASELQDQIKERLPEMKVSMEPTKAAGHAIELARNAARSGRPLIISVSGDGGYNEVVNGVVQAANDQAIAAVLPAGNANDHDRAVRDGELIDAIVSGQTKRLDLLRLEVTSGESSEVRYAHSYIGLGLTPAVALALNKHGKGSIQELWLSLKTYLSFLPFAIKVDGQTRRYDSLVFANINEMAKVATLSEDGAPDDGEFEVISVKAGPKLQLLYFAAKSAIFGLGRQPSVTRFAFSTPGPQPIQLDGEVMELKAGSELVVVCSRGRLRTLA